MDFERNLIKLSHFTTDITYWVLLVMLKLSAMSGTTSSSLWNV